MCLLRKLCNRASISNLIIPVGALSIPASHALYFLWTTAVTVTCVPFLFYSDLTHISLLLSLSSSLSTLSVCVDRVWNTLTSRHATGHKVSVLIHPSSNAHKSRHSPFDWEHILWTQWGLWHTRVGVLDMKNQRQGGLVLYHNTSSTRIVFVYPLCL